jgi:hypothetical protein
MFSATCLWHINKNKSELRSEQSVLSPDDVVLQSLYSIISIGTERIVASGQVPSNLHTQMRVPYMDGQFEFPVKYGYSLVAADVMGRKYHASPSKYDPCEKR